VLEASGTRQPLTPEIYTTGSGLMFFERPTAPAERSWDRASLRRNCAQAKSQVDVGKVYRPVAERRDEFSCGETAPSAAHAQTYRYSNRPLSRVRMFGMFHSLKWLHAIA
jgi:hypothetical protein